MKNIHIGGETNCNVERLLTTRLLIQANSGGGKSWLIRRLLEQSHGAVQHLVIDPEGEFATLREKFDYVLAARQGGDTIADPRSAKLLAERLLELGVSAILDIYELKPHERVRFVRLFLDALVDAPKQLWHPVIVVLDEAHVYCPEKGDAESADSVKGLCTRGRKRGFCAVLATQRLSKLHKDAAAECNNKLIGRSSLDIDMKRAADELGFRTKDDMLQLRDLKDGEFFAFGPAICQQVERVKVGAVATTHPKAGSHLAAVVPPPTAKVLAVLSKLSDLPAEAEARERTEADLRKEISTLKSKLTIAQKEQAPAPAPLPPKEIPAISADDMETVKNAVTRCEMIHRDMAEHSEHICELTQELAKIRGSLGVLISNADNAALRATRPALMRDIKQILHTPRAIKPSNGNGSTLGRCERAILTALAQYPQGRTVQQVAVLTGYSGNSGGFNNSLGKLRSSEYITRSQPMQITEAGLEALGEWTPLPSGTALQAHWLNQLGKCERAILETLLNIHPQGMTAQDLGDQTGYSANSGGFNNSLGRLRTLELITRGQPIKASDHFFQEA